MKAGLSDGLEGKTAVVTGGASGIGRATADLLAAAGAQVFVADLQEPQGAGEFLRTDVTDEGSIAALADAVLGRGGAPGVLVNAAGWDRSEAFLDNSLEFIDHIVRLNLLGCVKVTRAFLPAMVEAKAGKIVNVASDAGRVGSSGETVYASAKGGIIAFTKSLAREMARTPLHVNCVCPGPTDTPLFAALPEKLRQALVRAIPLRRPAKPEEVAQAVLFFAGRRSDYITGQILSVSGGLTMAG